MAVGDAQDFQNTLDGAVLARPAVQHIERHVRLEPVQHRRDVAPDIDPAYPKPLPFQRIGAGLAGAQRYVAFRGPTTHQNGDMLHALGSPRISWRELPI